MRSLVFFMLFSFISSMGQESILLIKGDFDTFTTDELGNIYALHEDELKLYRATGELWIRNSIKTMGTINAISAFYSLKPMLFSQEMQQVAVLDNTLAVQGDVIWLNRLGFEQATLVSPSVQNHFWVYDQLDMQLIRVNRQWERTSSTGRIDQLLGISPDPVGIVEYDNWVYLNDPLNGLLVFDLFCTYSKTIPVTNAKDIQIRKDGIYFLTEGKAWRYDRLHFESKEIRLSKEPITRVRIENNRILFLTRTGIHSVLRKDLNNK